MAETDRDDTDHPRRTLGLVGHGQAEAAVVDAWNRGRMPHAWLICGPAGIGKATFAYRLARFLLAAGERPVAGQAAVPEPSLLFGAPELAPEKPEAAASPRSLDVHPGSRVTALVAARGHPDCLAVERPWDEKKKRFKGEISVDQSRGIGTFLHRTASGGGWRVVIVDAVDEMNRNAANALLKALEEPPARAALLLVAHAPGRLLPTIKSRCRRLALSPLRGSEVEAVLAAKRPDASPADRAAAAAASGGSPGSAIALLDSDGLALRVSILALLARLPRLDGIAAQALADGLARNDAEDAWDSYRLVLADALREAARTAVAGAGPAAAPGKGEAAAACARLAALAQPARWLAAAARIERLFAQADGLNLDKKLVVMETLAVLRDTADGSAA